MKRGILFIFLSLALLLNLQAAKLAVLEGVNRPDMLAVSDNYIYITEKTMVHIFSFKNYKPLKSFGSEGEGPGEFKISPFGPAMIVSAARGRLVVNSLAKVSIFNEEGNYIKEFKVPPNQVYLPFGESYVYSGIGKNEEGKAVMSVNLANDKFQKIAELYQTNFVVGAAMKFDFPIDEFVFTTVGDNIYLVAGKQGFVIDVFDKKGQKVSTIKKEYQPLKLSPDYEKKTIHWFKTHPNWKNLYQMFEKRISFKSYYPPVYSIHGYKDRLYVMTHKKKGEDRQCILLDLQGKEIKQVYLPVPEVYGLGELPKFTFHNNAFYILKENEDEEVIELHKIDL